MTESHTPNTPDASTPRRSPSREMLGGPVLGVAVFLVIAVLLGWGLISILGVQLDGAVQESGAGAFEDGFDHDAAYVLQRDLLLGISSDGQRVYLYPDSDSLPTHAPNRRFVPRVADYLADPGDERYQDILGVVAAGTRVQFVRLIEDLDNRQTRYLVDTLVLDGEHEGIRARGMFLETTTPGEDDRPIISPHEDLFRAEAVEAPAEPDASARRVEPIQSLDAQPNDDADSLDPTDAPAE